MVWFLAELMLKVLDQEALCDFTVRVGRGSIEGNTPQVQQQCQDMFVQHQPAAVMVLLNNLGLCSQDELAEQTLKAMCRKFSGSAKIWLRNISWLLSKDRAEAARKALDRSFSALPQRKHIKVCKHLQITLIQSFIHSYIHTFIHSYIHTFNHSNCMLCLRPRLATGSMYCFQHHMLICGS